MYILCTHASSDYIKKKKCEKSSHDIGLYVRLGKPNILYKRYAYSTVHII